jgi:hypothetical protein
MFTICQMVEGRWWFFQAAKSLEEARQVVAAQTEGQFQIREQFYKKKKVRQGKRWVTAEFPEEKIHKP